MDITNIDFSQYDDSKPETINALADQVYQALSTTGFMSVTHIGISKALRDAVFAMSKSFFSQSWEEKNKVGYLSAKENFGYQGIGMEHLDPSKPADLKETFTMRDIAKYLDQAERWPSTEFRDLVTTFYNECFTAAKRIMRVFSAALEQDTNFFINCHKGNNVTLRLLHYPSFTGEIEEQQLGAGAHTDYGMITLLFQDGVEALEVCDKHGNWLPASAEPDRILINTGDLMNRWTNNMFRSTPHRVRPIVNGPDRYSIAMFVDPDEDTVIETLPSCIDAQRPNLYPPISAGDHILEKIKATHGRAAY